MKIKKWIYIIHIFVVPIMFVSINFLINNLIKKHWLDEKDNSLVIILLYFIVVLCISLLISELIIYKVIKPIENLKCAIDAFGKGENLDIKYNIEDEVGMLVNAFGKMRKEVEEKREIIDKEHRTREYMIASISHDLKTPITSIRLYAELINGNVNEEDKDKYTNIILDKCDYIKDMIDNLLMYTILESGCEKKFVNVEGTEFFEMLFEGYDTICDSNDIMFTKDIKCDGYYKVNVNEMTRVMDNLVGNAIKYTNKGNNIWVGAFSDGNNLSKWIDLEIRENIKELLENKVVILVKNEGEEILSSEKENIFKSFYKSDLSRQADKGVGIGLSVVKLIIEQHGGFVNVYPIKGIGNIFACFLNKIDN